MVNVRADADLAGHADRAAQLLDDLLRNRQAEPEAAPLGGDEVVEDRVEPLLRDAAAGVGDLDDRLTVLSRSVRTTTRPRGGVACMRVDDAGCGRRDSARTGRLRCRAARIPARFRSSGRRSPPSSASTRRARRRALLTSSGNRSSGSGRAMLRRSSSTRLTCASSRSTVRLKFSRYSRSSNIFTISLQLLPMFWIGCERSCTRPMAMRPNIACRSFFRTSSCSSTSLSAMLLKASAELADLVGRCRPSRARRGLPSASARVPRVSARIGSMKLRPQKYPTAASPSARR